MSHYYCCSSIGSDFSRRGPSRSRVGWAPRATPHFNHWAEGRGWRGQSWGVDGTAVPQRGTGTEPPELNRIIICLADRTSCCAQHGVCLWRCALWLIDAAKVSEEVNRKCRTRNTTVQISTPYTSTLSPKLFTELVSPCYERFTCLQFQPQFFVCGI